MATAIAAACEHIPAGKTGAETYKVGWTDDKPAVTAADWPR
ncbi:hypothetical protein ACTMTI_14465 [Nonomuraea sp. H19]